MKIAIVALLVGLSLVGCQANSADKSPSADSCIGIGNAVVSDLDWAPTSDELAVVLSWGAATVSVGRLKPGDGSVTEIARFVEVAPASVTIGPAGEVYWQSSDEGETRLFRQGRGQDPEVWNVPGFGFSALEATVAGIAGSTLVEIGGEHDVLELVDVVLKADGTVVTQKRAIVPGLKAVSMSADGTILAVSARLKVGDPAEISVSGRVSWSASLEDAAGSHIALTPDGSAVMFVRSSTGTAMLIDETGTVTPSVLAAREVLALDIAPSGVVAAGSANITGGPGSICFAGGE